MDVKRRIEIARNLLDNAATMNISKELLLKISVKIDQYIVEYYREHDKRYIHKQSIF